MEKFDKIILTNLPSFYKINLYNELSKSQKIKVAYTCETWNKRNSDFFVGEQHYSYVMLHGTPLKKCINLIKFIRTAAYEEFIIGGWHNYLYWLANILSPKLKNACNVETSIYETTLTGIKGVIKRWFFSRINKVYASGIAQEEYVRCLGYDREIRLTGGCGILNYVSQPPFKEKSVIKNFLYVGRLAKEKNLKTLISVFNSLPDLKLTIVGFGPEESALKNMARDNIVFAGAVDNKQLWKIYQLHDVFVLPSLSEPWGLVVEEALNNGLPVIASDRVGCSKDLIGESRGIIIDIDKTNALRDAIVRITDASFYNELSYNVSLINFEERKKYQITCYK